MNDERKKRERNTTVKKEKYEISKKTEIAKKKRK